MAPTLLLFDIDGTLLDTGGIGRRVMRAIAEREFSGELNFEPIRFGGMLDPDIFAQAAHHGGLAHAHTHHQRFHDAYLPALNLELRALAPGQTLLPGIRSLLDLLMAEPARSALGMVTGNYPGAADLKLRHAGIDPAAFRFTGFGDQAPTRAGLVVRAMQQYAAAYGTPADPQRTIVIGDTPRDIDCAKDNGCVAFGVATGRASAEELREHGADIVVENLLDPEPLLALI